MNAVTLTLDEKDHQRVAAAIRNAEARTSGEIVCVLARASDSYFYPAALTLGAGILLASLLVAFGLDHYWIAMRLWHFVAAQMAASVCALGLIWLFPGMRIIFVPRQLRYRRAHRNAVTQFLSRNIHTTSGRTGVLIFLSLAERYAEVVADAGIDSRVPQETWDSIVGELVRHAASDRIVEGFEMAIAAAGELLAREFPKRTTDVNELDDRLVEL